MMTYFVDYPSQRISRMRDEELTRTYKNYVLGLFAGPGVVDEREPANTMFEESKVLLNCTRKDPSLDAVFGEHHVHRFSYMTFPVGLFRHELLK